LLLLKYASYPAQIQPRLAEVADNSPARKGWVGLKLNYEPASAGGTTWFSKTLFLHKPLGLYKTQSVEERGFVTRQL